MTSIRRAAPFSATAPAAPLAAPDESAGRGPGWGPAARHLLRWLLALPLYYLGVLRLYRRWRARRGAELQVLRYHRVIPDGEPEPVYRLGVHRRSFARQMRHLARRGAAIDLEAARHFLGAEGGGGGMKFLVTLDDGYRDNATEAQPELRRAGVPAVVFVATGFVGGRRFPWERLKNIIEDPGRHTLLLPGGGRVDLADRRRAFRRLHRWLERLPAGDAEALLSLWETAGHHGWRNDGPLSWEEVRVLDRGGVHVGSHTIRHRRLSRLDAVELERELSESRRCLEEQLGRTVTAFAYPSGDHDRRVVDAVARAGYDIAFTTVPGTNRPGAAPLELRRKGISGPSSETPWGSFSPALFEAEICGFFDHWLRGISH